MWCGTCKLDRVCLIAGESGLGKSTMINSLFLSELYNDQHPGPSHRARKTVHVSMTEVYYMFYYMMTVYYTLYCIIAVCYILYYMIVVYYIIAACYVL